MHARSSLLWSLLLGCVLAGAVGVRSAHAQEDERCQRCDPSELVAASRAAMDQTTAWRLPGGDPARPQAAPYVLRAQEDAELGLGSGAVRFARQAAARCLLGNEVACGDSLQLLGELTLLDGAGTPAREREALAYFSLVPWENVARARCVEGMVLRYRLSERYAARRADPAWADLCGPLGAGGELGYRAAKAALIGGQFEDAERRLETLARAGTEHVVRASYLLAVLRVAQGRDEEAAADFAAIAALPIRGRRPAAEDDARTLAMLQLARLAREGGDRELAQELYAGVAPHAAGREDALLEGAVVAGQRGDFGRTRLYLDALAAYRPEMRRQLSVQRLRANVAVVDGDEEVARATFRELSRVGREVRAQFLGGGPAATLQRLHEDPALGGLLDPDDGAQLIAVADGLRWVQAQVEAGEAQTALLRQTLADGVFAGDLDLALEELEAASSLLRQAEQVIGARERSGDMRLAGPASAALRVAREASRLRGELEANIARVREARDRRRARLAQRLEEVAAELRETRATLATLEPVLREDIRALQTRLIARAHDVAEDLELAEEVGDLELAWRAKGRSSLAVERAYKEYDDAKLDLATSVDGGQSKVNR